MNLLTYWKYFLAIEDDFIKTIRYVEVVPENYKTYSIEYAKILLTAGAEVDVICKIICKELDPTKKSDNIESYREIIINNAPELYKKTINLESYEIELTPWETWRENTTPSWWNSYNKVKHHRSDHYNKANLKNTLDALAGLMVLLLYLFRKVENSEPPISSQLFGTAYFGATLIIDPERQL